MITDYASLKAAIALWLKRDDLTDSIPYFIQMFEAEVNRKLMQMNPPHFCLLQPAIEGTLTNDGSAPFLVALPDGYKGTQRFQIQQSGNYRDLRYKTPQQMAEYSVGSQPMYYTINGENLEIAATPSNNYDYRWEYFAPLSSVADGTNWLIENAPDAYLYGSLLHSAPFLKNDARLATWAGLFSDAMNDLELNNTLYHQSGSTLQMRSDSAI